MRLRIFLVALAVALLGAATHPLAWLLHEVGPANPRLLALMTRTKTFLTDLSFWGLFAFFLIMAGMVAADRLRRPRAALDRGLPDLPDLPKSPRVVVALTAYNEVEAIRDVVEDFRAQDGVVEVIVVDNNSVDGTAEVAAAAGARVVREARQGYGYACMRGLAEAAACAEADVVVLAEGEGTFAGKDIAKFLAYIHDSEMVLGTRVVPGLVDRGSQMDRFFTWGNIFAGTLVRLRFWDSQFLGQASLSDVGCTYRAIRRDVLERILPDLNDGGNTFSLNMIVVALHRRLIVVEVPVTFRRRVGVSKGASRSMWAGLKIGLQMIWQTISFKPQRPEPLSAPAGTAAR